MAACLADIRSVFLCGLIFTYVAPGDAVLRVIPQFFKGLVEKGAEVVKDILTERKLKLFTSPNMRYI
jgi:hypothetical protein